MRIAWMAVSNEPWPVSMMTSDAGALLADGLQDLEAVHVGQLQVEQHHLGLELRRRLDGLLSRARPGDLEAQALELAGHDPAEGRVVVDEEERRDGLHWMTRRGAARPAAGQHHLERGPRPGRAADLDVAAPVPDEVQGQEEPEPRPAAPGAEERLEDPLLDLRRDAAPVVRDADADRIVSGGSQDHPAALLARLDGVQRAG